MIIGQVLHASQEAPFTYYSPWMMAEGNLAVVSCEVIEAHGCAMDIAVETKSAEQSDKDKTTPAGGSGSTIATTTEALTKFNVGAKLSDTVTSCRPPQKQGVRLPEVYGMGRPSRSRVGERSWHCNRHMARHKRARKRRLRAVRRLWVCV
jgi:hypothetical protein